MLPPLLVPQLPAATYGGMAHVLAHEVSHAFDVDAAPANADGLYREWYSPITRSRIQDRKLCLRDMYLVPVNLPWVTEGEDYADALGLTVRFWPTALGYAARKTRPAQYVIVGAESRPAPSGKHGKTRREAPQGGRRVSLGPILGSSLSLYAAC